MYNQITNILLPKIEVSEQRGFVLLIETTTASEEIGLDLSSGFAYNFSVTWGDGERSEITSYNDINRFHTYQYPGTYTIEIIGVCEFLFPVYRVSDNSRYLTKEVVYFGDKTKLEGFKVLTFNVCTNLTLNNNVGSILFKRGATANAIVGLFSGCSSLVNVPDSVFLNCDSYNITNFYRLFSSATSLTNISSNLFLNCDKIQNWEEAFYNCTSLETFNPRIKGVNFNSCFYNCTNLYYINNIYLLDGYNIDLSYCFDSCNNLILDYYTFVGPTANNQNINFSYCFYRSTYNNSSIGIAQPIWDIYTTSNGYGTITKTECFGGSGNNTDSISNYNDIPIEWK